MYHDEMLTCPSTGPRGGLILLGIELRTLSEIADGRFTPDSISLPARDAVELLERFGLVAEQGERYEVTDRGHRLLVAEPTYRTGGFYRYDLADLLG